MQPTTNTLTPVGACRWVDEAGQLWLAQSFEGPGGIVTTTQTALANPDPEALASPER